VGCADPADDAIELRSEGAPRRGVAIHRCGCALIERIDASRLCGATLPELALGSLGVAIGDL
jgi:hypothetical protein